MHTSEARTVCVPVCVPGVPGVLATTFLTRLCMERIERDVVGVAGVVSAASLWQCMQHPDRGGQRVHRVLVGQPPIHDARDVKTNESSPCHARRRSPLRRRVAMLCAFLCDPSKHCPLLSRISGQRRDGSVLHIDDRYSSLSFNI